MARTSDPQCSWYDPGVRPPWWALPLAVLYAGATGVRRGLYRHGWLRSVRLPVPVVVVGNISVGGTGKTPLVMALVEGLRDRGFAPGVVSRGYGGSAHSPRLLDARPDPATVGDEPALIRLRTGAPVAIGADRPAAARLLLDRGVDVIVSDDGLQHYRLARTVEICVVDGARRFGNGHLLPAGPLREPVARLAGVDFVVCNGGTPQAGEVPMRVDVHDVVSLGEPACTRPLGDFAGMRVHAVAGIGNPDRFFAALRAWGIGVMEHPFPDHHRYVAGDLDFGDDRPVLMTGKDAVKCGALAARTCWSVPATARVPPSFLDALACAITARLNPRAERRPVASGRRA